MEEDQLAKEYYHEARLQELKVLEAKIQERFEQENAAKRDMEKRLF